MEMKKTYEKPSVTVIGMETEQAMASLSSWNTTGKLDNQGFDIIEGNPDNIDDGDLRHSNTNSINDNWAKSHNVWE